MSDSFKALLDAGWSELSVPASPPGERPGVSWSWRLSPPFPSEWPPREESRIVYYAFAEGFDLSVMDGVRVGAPWLRLEVPVSGHAPPVLIPMRGSVEELGIQGVRPLSAAEVAESGGSESIGTLLGSLMARPGEPGDARVRLSACYGFWTRNNGVIAQAIAPLYRDFFDWLKGG
jgi:hypothetical protein